MNRFATSVLCALSLAGCSSGGSGDAAPGSAAPPPAAPVPSTNDPPQSPSALFVLGDSLSDIGNAAGAADYLLGLVTDPPTVGLCNPADVLLVPRRCDDLFYRRSRVSDGPVAVEHLAAHLGVAELEPSLHIVPGRSKTATAYAVAGAKARGQGDQDLGRQLDWLLLDHAPLPSDAVYVVMIGGNDAIDALQADMATPGVTPKPSAAIVTSSVAAIGAAVERLLDFGARRLVVANVPDLAVLPAVRTRARATPDAAMVLANASAISTAFDSELRATLDRIEAGRSALFPKPVITRFDLRAALTSASAAVRVAGGNEQDACFDSDLYRAATAERVFHPDCAPAAAGGVPRFSEFVYWDGIHPTGAAHARLGAALTTSF